MLRTFPLKRIDIGLKKKVFPQNFEQVHTKGQIESVRRFFLKFKQKHGYLSNSDVALLTRKQVSSILKINEVSVDADGPIKNFEVNKLPANKPIEDRDTVAKLTHGEKNKYIFGVYDGHGGSSCSQALSERLFNYISVSMSTQDILKDIACENHGHDKLVDWYPYQSQYFNHELDQIYKDNLAKFAKETLANFEECSVEEHLRHAFLRLDHDIMSECLPVGHDLSINDQALENGLSGSCACIALVDDIDLYVANTGDCKAVLGVEVDKDHWNTVEMSHAHTGYNSKEVRRVLNSHPNESSHVIKGGRLFGSLAPLRAFGDMMYKWSVKERNQYLKLFKQHPNFNVYSEVLMHEHYITPPYLTAEPEIIHRKLTPKDKFLVIASDGLYDMIPPEKVVKLVAGHMEGKQVLVDPNFDIKGRTIKEINQRLRQRKSHLSNVPTDDNVATHLMRNALGPEHGRLSTMLSLHDDIARSYRDDISIIVVFFDTDYVKNFYVEAERDIDCID
ncbi:pyruvate dehydrogenase [acetyl-transferring]-phosphatase 1, mitochondrial-like [Mytilus californianus]|uniref:pyruvate dehydrogenase [acetyl-transferring]-phosphatase 1, mitochondrial-like n=1 Tax=Mytilus californianus TaxID=6549 RepID=UPI0022477C97|nr:pyruvate dehydrogenase [acetyl-transferring]-phosphatase 1, mitochondrial-like [Mytilus californianus]